MLERFREVIQGVHGQERQAQAIGQMVLGSTFMGTAGRLANTGFITGGGPSDPKLKSALKVTGWQPYSLVIRNEDGSRTYVDFGRYDPVALPFGIVADIVDIASAAPATRPRPRPGSTRSTGSSRSPGRSRSEMPGLSASPNLVLRATGQVALAETMPVSLGVRARMQCRAITPSGSPRSA